MITWSPRTKDAYRLFHEGAQALAQVERNGMAIDMPYCERKLGSLKKKIKRMKGRLMEEKPIRMWRRLYGEKFKLSSNQQLADVLFNELGYTTDNLTKSGKPKVDDSTLKAFEVPFVQLLLELRKLEKARNTYFKGITREVTDGFLHAFFNLHLARTYRSSSDHPNFQNMPVRVKWIAELIRSAFVPRPGRRIGEFDYKGIEVAGAACNCLDPILISYIKDKTKDMHRDQAMDCYLLPQDEITKDIRYCGKNKFVFPEFYGDYYVSCAAALWESIELMNLVTASGVPLKEHLASNGIKTYKAYERHIEDVEYRFWNEKFKVFYQWRKDIYKSYLRKGYVDTLTGFRCSGVMKRNEVCNYPVQGPSFHCLLQSVIDMVRWCGKNRMESMVVGQIHDSMVNDIVPAELNDYMSQAVKIMTKDLPAKWKWIIVPLEVEMELTPVDKPWYLKAKYDPLTVA